MVDWKAKKEGRKEGRMVVCRIDRRTVRQELAIAIVLKFEYLLTCIQVLQLLRLQKEREREREREERLDCFAFEMKNQLESSLPRNYIVG